MVHKSMEVYRELFLEVNKRKVHRFFIVPEAGKEQQAIKQLNQQVMKYVIDTGISYNHFQEVGNPYVQLIVEGINE
jgi:hypothetical protein